MLSWLSNVPLRDSNPDVCHCGWGGSVIQTLKDQEHTSIVGLGERSATRPEVDPISGHSEPMAVSHYHLAVLASEEHEPACIVRDHLMQSVDGGGGCPAAVVKGRVYNVGAQRVAVSHDAVGRGPQLVSRVVEPGDVRTVVRDHVIALVVPCTLDPGLIGELALFAVLQEVLAVGAGLDRGGEGHVAHCISSVVVVGISLTDVVVVVNSPGREPVVAR